VLKTLFDPTIAEHRTRRYGDGASESASVVSPAMPAEIQRSMAVSAQNLPQDNDRRRH
jgi:hypothetical protein